MRLVARLALAAVVANTALPQSELYYQKDFPAEEFQARWAKVFNAIGERAIAVVQGFPKVGGFVFPRQTNEFYYLCGIEAPGSTLVLDGRTRTAALFLPPRDERLERSEGRILSAADAELARKITGAAEVLSTNALTPEWLEARLGPTGAAVYTPLAPAEGSAQSRYELAAANRAIASDPWDGRVPREARFFELLRARLRRAEIRDLSPVLDSLRIVKSPREIALIRRASEIAGQGMIEAIRTTRPGLLEYQLEAAARYVFLVNGARLDAYRSITAAGSPNIWNAHYYRNDAPLLDGDLVLMDYAPDYHYYVSDIGRMWPINGKYGAQQRDLLGFVLLYRNAVLKRIRPGVTPKDILAEVRREIEPVLAGMRFSKPIYAQAARKLLETGGGAFSHPVGMAVHDVGSYEDGPLKPGHVFALDPQMWVPEEKLYFRYEDTVAVTATGVENFTDFLPVELADLEKLVSGKGIVQSFPPSPRRRVECR